MGADDEEYGQPVFRLAVYFEFPAVDAATAILTLREHLVGIDYRSIEVVSPNPKHNQGLTVNQ